MRNVLKVLVRDRVAISISLRQRLRLLRVPKIEAIIRTRGERATEHKVLVRYVWSMLLWVSTSF